MNKNLPGGRFRIFLAVLGVCVAAGIALSYFEQDTAAGPRNESGRVEKMVVANGTVTVDLDMSRLNGKGLSSRQSLRFAVGSEDLLSVLVFNDQLRGLMPGSAGLAPQNTAALPARLNASYNQLALESRPEDEYQLAIRDAKTGFVFFYVQGQMFEYDATQHVFSIRDGRVLLSTDFASALGRPSAANSVVGEFSVTANMRTVETQEVVDGEVRSDVLPAGAGSGSDSGSNPGPDVVVGNLIDIAQFNGQSGTQVGIAIGTESCNFGVVDLDWFALSNLDHPVIPQNLYRMSGGTTNDERFEQIGQSNMKHAFTALTNNICNLGCNGVGGSHLGSGCSDPYTASLNSGPGLGSRAWVNPYNGSYTTTDPNNHSGHTHTGPAHKILTEVNDLNTTLNPGATYYGEAMYVTPHEYTWCHANPGVCTAGSGNNTYNNVSYRKVNVSGTASPFGFTWDSGPNGGTKRMLPAINAWTGATIVRIEPDPGNDGIAYIAYKVTGPTVGIYHYEYAIYNQNLDRAIQSFTLPVGSGVTKNNLGFHAPPQQPGWTFDGTTNNAGFSNTPWALTESANSSIWSSLGVAQDPNANAVRWGTLYNIRFDSDREPSTMYATIGFFKTGSPAIVQVQGPSSPLAPWPCNTRHRPGAPLPNCG